VDGRDIEWSDAHPTLGNNALLCRALGFKKCEAFFVAKGQAIGLKTRVSLSLAELARRLERVLGEDRLGHDVDRPAEPHHERLFGLRHREDRAVAHDHHEQQQDQGDNTCNGRPHRVPPLCC
jgi:putative NIF3 family GTP cyclohydrolase 1 type 2